ncbi:hypothetical protein [Acidithiobacillus sulfuriphilus]|uniref:hypothetical protein n=1 Tax=Acidithiobacillus sulfuriphilus TaxID=1867749 RepID=UPI003F644C33
MNAIKKRREVHLSNITQSLLFIFAVAMIVNISAVSTAYGITNRSDGNSNPTKRNNLKIKELYITPTNTQTALLQYGKPIILPPFQIKISSVKIADAIRNNLNNPIIKNGKIKWGLLQAKPGYEFIIVSWAYEGMTQSSFNILTGPSMVLYSPNSRQIDEDLDGTASYQEDQGISTPDLEQQPGIWIPDATVFSVSKSKFDDHTWKILITTAGRGVYLSMGKAVSTTK